MFNAKTSLIAAMVLLLGVFLIQRDMVRTAKQEIAEETKKNLISDSPKLTFDWIEISFPGEKKVNNIRFRCAEKPCTQGTNQKWMAEEPAGMELDSVLVAAALSSVMTSRPEERIALTAMAGRDWQKEFGFADPALKLVVKFSEEEKPTEIRYGIPTPVGMNHYVMSSRNPDTVFTIQSYNFRALDRELFHWQEKRLLAGAQDSQVQRLEWKHSLGGEELAALREEGIWYLPGKEKWRADGKVLQGLVSRLASWATERIATEADWKLAKPYAAIRSFWAGDKKNELEFRLLKDRMLVRSSDRKWVGEVKKPMVDAWLRTKAELRDPVILTDKEKQSLKRLRVRWPKTEESLELSYQEPGLFQVDAAKQKPGFEADGEKVTALGRLFILATVKARIPASGALAERWTKSPDLVVEFLGDGDAVVQKLQLLSDFKDWVLVNGESSAELRKLDGMSAKALPRALKDLAAPAASR